MAHCSGVNIRLSTNYFLLQKNNKKLVSIGKGNDIVKHKYWPYTG